MELRRFYIISSLAFVLALGFLAYSNGDAVMRLVQPDYDRFQALKRESANVFQYARVNPEKLSAQKLRALSIGLAFRDLRLVESSLGYLNAQMR